MRTARKLKTVIVCALCHVSFRHGQAHGEGHDMRRLQRSRGPYLRALQGKRTEVILRTRLVKNPLMITCTHSKRGWIHSLGMLAIMNTSLPFSDE